MSDDRWELGRRQFVSTVGAAATVAATATAAPARALELGEAPVPPAADSRARLDPEVARLLGDIRPGATLDRWTVDSIEGVHMGAIAIVLRTSGGTRFQVDVLRRDDRPGARLGVASSRQLSVFLANRGDGATATDEELGLGAMALRDALATREAAGVPVPALLTHAERRARHPVGSYSILAQ